MSNPIRPTGGPLERAKARILRRPMSAARMAQAVQQRPDATAVSRIPPSAPVFDPDQWTDPDDETPDIYLASLRPKGR